VRCTVREAVLYAVPSSSLLGSNIFLSTLLSNTLTLRSSLNVRDHVSHAYKAIRKIIVLYALYVSKANQKKMFCTEQYQAFRDFNLLLIYSLMQLWFVWIVRKYLNFATLWNGSLPIFVLWLCPAFCSRDTWYLVFAAFTSRSFFSLATNKASVFLTVWMFSLNKLARSTEMRSWCVPFNFNPSWFVWTFQTAYSKTRSKSNNEKVHLSSKSNNEKVHPSPSFRSFLIENVSDKYLSIGDLHYVSVQHIFH